MLGTTHGNTYGEEITGFYYLKSQIVLYTAGGHVSGADSDHKKHLDGWVRGIGKKQQRSLVECSGS